MRDVVFEPELAERLGKQYRMEKPPANLSELIEHVNAQVRASPDGAEQVAPIREGKVTSARRTPSVGNPLWPPTDAK